MSQQQTVLRVQTNIPSLTLTGTTRYEYLDLYDDVPIKINKSFAYTFQDNKKTEFKLNPSKTKEFLTSISEKISKEDFHKQKNAFCKDCQFSFYCWGEKNG